MASKNIQNYENNEFLISLLTFIDQTSEKLNNRNWNSEKSLSSILEYIVENTYKVINCASIVINIGDEIFSSINFKFLNAESHINLLEAEKKQNQYAYDIFPKILFEKTFREKKAIFSYESDLFKINDQLFDLGINEFACFPIQVNNTVEGNFILYLTERRKLQPAELLLLNIVSNQAAMAIHQSRIQQNISKDLLQKEDELDRLHRAGMLISSRLKLEQTLVSILEIALEMTNAHYGIFRLVDPSNNNLVTRAFVGNDMTRPKLEMLPIDSQSVMAQVARNQQSILIEDLQSKEWSDKYYPLDAGLQMKSELAVPLINASGRLEGVLNIESPFISAFNENDRHMLQSLATYAVTSIQEVRLLDALKDLAKRIFSQPYSQVMNHLTQIACELLNASTSTIWLVNDDYLVVEAAFGANNFSDNLLVNSSLPGLSIIKNDTIVSEDIYSDKNIKSSNFSNNYEWSKALMVPIQLNDGEPAIGVFGVFSSKNDPGNFAKSDWDKKVLTFLSYYAVMLIQNEKQQSELRSTQEQRSIAETFAAVGDIASNLLHQLNNKIGTIPVRVQNIQEKSLSSVQNDEYLKKNLLEIERCAMEAMQTVKDNLVHLRPIQIEKINIKSKINDAINHSNISPTVKINLVGIDNLPEVKAGGHSLLLVFSNLIENAVDAMQGHGLITITGTQYINFVELIIADSGPGIMPELHEKIFELNYSSRLSTRPGKLGFGLWWVKTLITRIGGSISVKSDGINGTQFHLFVPIAEIKL